MDFEAISQVTLNDIDFRKIPQKKVRSYIINQRKHNVIRFSDVLPSCKKDEDLSGYKRHVKTYIVKESLFNVWSNYITINPAEAWRGRRVSFGMLISKRNNTVMYADGNYDGIDTGQVLYINIGVLLGLENMAVAFEIINVDKAGRVIEFSYIQGGRTLGKQRMQFFATDDGFTKIIHSSYFRSGSKIRDAILYPYFHEKIIDEFHRNMVRKLTKREIQPVGALI